MIFKGGTALNKIYFKNFRFSEDLDFDCFEDISVDLIHFLKYNIKEQDIEFTEISNLEKKGKGFKFKIKYNQAFGQKSNIRIDLSLRGNVVMEYSFRPILHVYETIPNVFSLPVMNLEEIMAEKISAIIYTKHPRHLYDVYYLHNQGVKINPQLVRAKIKNSYGEDFSINKLKERLPEKAKDWIVNLRPLLSTPLPSYDDVSKQVFEFITKEMKA
jgi:predicted nucleotidyltransferase component of viral defense system